MTLGTGLSVDAKRSGVQFENKGVAGCDFDEGLPSHVPVKSELKATRLGYSRLDARAGPRPGKIGCQLPPAVVGLLMGRWDVFDRFYDGHWVHVGDADWDAHLIYAMNKAISVLSSRGAHVILFTTPYVSPTAGDDVNGVDYVENEASRVDIYNQLVRQVAAQHKGASARSMT